MNPIGPCFAPPPSPEPQVSEIDQILSEYGIAFDPQTIFYLLWKEYHIPISPQTIDTLFDAGAVCPSEAYDWLTCYQGAELDAVISCLLLSRVRPGKDAVKVALMGNCSYASISFLKSAGAEFCSDNLAHAFTTSNARYIIEFILAEGILPTEQVIADLFESVATWRNLNDLKGLCISLIEMLPAVSQSLLCLGELYDVPQACLDAVQKKIVQSNTYSLEDLLLSELDEEFPDKFLKAIEETETTTTEALHLALDLNLPDEYLEAIVQKGAIPNCATYIKSLILQRSLPFSINTETDDPFLQACVDNIHPADLECYFNERVQPTTEHLALAVDLGLSVEFYELLCQKGAQPDRSILAKISRFGV